MEVNMTNAVKDTPAAVKPVAKKSAELTDEETNPEVQSGMQPEWIARLATRWKNHHHVDLELRFTTGAEINKDIGPTEERQPRGAEVVKTVSTAIGIDISTVSYMRRFSELVQTFEEFEAKYPKCKTWSAVKKLLAGQSSDEDEDDDDEQLPEVKSLILRVRNTRIALKKLRAKKITVSGRDMTELRLELEKLAETLAKRANLQLTVASIEEEVLV
jgi:hypothetical protein